MPLGHDIWWLAAVRYWRSHFALCLDQLFRSRALPDGSEGPAEATGRVSLGDVISSIDGQPCECDGFQTVVGLLMAAPDTMVLGLKKEPLTFRPADPKSTRWIHTPPLL